MSAMNSYTDDWVCIHRWDEGLLDMCIGDKRKLTIPPEFGYGQRAMGAIPAGSTLGKYMELLGTREGGADAVRQFSRRN